MKRERDARGRFLPGWKGGPGRPSLAAQLPFIQGVKAAGSAEKVRQVMDMLLEQALNRKSAKHAELWLQYMVGTPTVGLTARIEQFVEGDVSIKSESGSTLGDVDADRIAQILTILVQAGAIPQSPEATGEIDGDGYPNGKE